MGSENAIFNLGNGISFLLLLERKSVREREGEKESVHNSNIVCACELFVM